MKRFHTCEWWDSKTLQLIAPAGLIVMNSRPNLTIEETELNFLNAKTWIPGKIIQEINICYLDAENSEGATVFSMWLRNCWENMVNLAPQSFAIIKSYFADGKFCEQWHLESASVTQYDYLSHDIFWNISIQIRYSEVHWFNESRYDFFSC